MIWKCYNFYGIISSLFDYRKKKFLIFFRPSSCSDITETLFVLDIVHTFAVASMVKRSFVSEFVHSIAEISLKHLILSSIEFLFVVKYDNFLPLQKINCIPVSFVKEIWGSYMWVRLTTKVLFARVSSIHE